MQMRSDFHHLECRQDRKKEFEDDVTVLYDLTVTTYMDNKMMHGKETVDSLSEFNSYI